MTTEVEQMRVDRLLAAFIRATKKVDPKCGSELFQAEFERQIKLIMCQDALNELREQKRARVVGTYDGGEYQWEHR